MAKEEAKTLKKAIADIKPRQFVRLEQISTGGTLELRKSSTGALSFYFRFTLNYKTERLLIGLYDSSAPPSGKRPTKRGYSLAAARAAASALADTHHEAREVGGLAEVMKSEAAAARAQKESEKATGQTLELLFEEYAKQLAERNKETAKQARNLFAKNVKTASPEVAETQANKVSVEQIADVLRPLSQAGKKTTARKLKAYLSSAFETAKNVESSATISVEFKKFDVKRNPVSDVSGITNSRGVDKNPLTPDEMQRYWEIINKPGREAAFLRLHLLLGGQRIEQLLRLKNEDIGRGRLVLDDTKGRTGNVRHILVPLIPEAMAALDELKAEGEFALSVTGEKPMGSTTVRTWAKKVVGDALADFELKRIRSGATTLLTKLGVNKEVRCHLQSHELSGVEAAHYNMHDFFDEKKAALTAMRDFLAAKGVGVSNHDEFLGSTHITPADKNIFLELGFSPEEAAQLLRESEARIAAKLAGHAAPQGLALGAEQEPPSGGA